MSRRCDYYFLCVARIQESLSEGGEGGGRKTTVTTCFFNSQLILQFYRGGPTFSKGSKFSWGIQMRISINTHITCDFPEGVRTPCPPLDLRMFVHSLSLEVSKSIPGTPTRFILNVFYGVHDWGWSRPRQDVDAILSMELSGYLSFVALCSMLENARPVTLHEMIIYLLCTDHPNSDQ